MTQIVLDEDQDQEPKESQRDKEGGEQEESKANQEKLVERLPRKECRYAVMHFGFKTSDGAPRSKLVYVLWCPDTCPVKQKLVYASSSETIKRRFEGIAAEIQAGDVGDLSYESFLERAARGAGNQ